MRSSIPFKPNATLEADISFKSQSVATSLFIVLSGTDKPTIAYSNFFTYSCVDFRQG
jgi:hypothetical protein